jgi:hypothetical protein
MLEHSTTSRVFQLLGLLLGLLLADALLLPLCERLGGDGREGAGELVALGFEEVFDCEGGEGGVCEEGFFGGALFFGFDDEAGGC